MCRKIAASQRTSSGILPGTGIGAFDYWVYYISGRTTRPEDHSSHGATSWRDYFRVNTDHKVIGIQYVCTTFVFFVIGGLLAMLMRAELAQPGTQIVDPGLFNGLFSTHAAFMIFLFIIPAIPAILGNFVLPAKAGDVTVSDSLSWDTLGTMSGTGRTVLAAGVFTGVLTSSGMLASMAQDLVRVLPASLLAEGSAMISALAADFRAMISSSECRTEGAVCAAKPKTPHSLIFMHFSSDS